MCADTGLTIFHGACPAAVLPYYYPGYVGSLVMLASGCGLCVRPPFSHRAKLAQLE